MALPGWKRYKEITLTGNGASEETDINYVIPVSKETEMQDDFRDIRFVDSDESTVLKQHRESYVSGTSSIWIIKVPSLPVEGKTIYLYYDNSEASLLSDAGLDVYEWYDDFTGDLSKWDTYDQVEIVNNYLRIWMDWGHLVCWARTKALFGMGKAFRCRMWNEELGLDIQNTGWSFENNYYVHRLKIYRLPPVHTEWLVGAGNDNFEDADEEVGHQVWKVIMLKRINSTDLKGYIEDVLDDTRTQEAETSDYRPFLYRNAASPGGEVRYDWFGVLNLPTNQTEPSVGEPQYAVLAGFTADNTTPVTRQIVRFTDQSIGQGLSYSWNFGDGHTSTEQNPHHAYQLAGTYTVMLTVTDAYDQQDAEVKTDYITVIDVSESEAFQDTDVGKIVDDIAFRINDPHLDGRIDGWNR